MFPAIYGWKAAPMLEFCYFITDKPAARYTPMNPTFDDPKLPILGNTNRMSVLLTPNHFASVAAYWSTDVVGIAQT